MTAKIEGKQGKPERLTALNREWPITTGSPEDTGRNLIGDRLDITGVRWGLADAAAVLTLRSVHTNDDPDDEP